MGTHVGPTDHQEALSAAVAILQQTKSAQNLYDLFQDVRVCDYQLTPDMSDKSKSPNRSSRD